MKRFRLDIENKILIPFIALLILSVLTLGVVSYWNGYQMLLQNEVQNVTKHLEDMMVYLDELNEQVETGAIDMETARNQALRHFQEVGRGSGFIIAGGQTLLVNHYRTDLRWVTEFLQHVAADENTEVEHGSASLRIDGDIFVHQAYPAWGWVLGYGMKRDVFAQEVLESQKYIILLAIVALVLSMQASIIIAYHISRPIKQLAEVFGKVGEVDAYESIQLKRQDEIGQLADAFNDMMSKLKLNTSKLMEMTRLNEDILRNISTGIMTTDPKGELISLNPAAKELLNQLDVNKDAGETVQLLRRQIQQTIESGEGYNEILHLPGAAPGSVGYLDVMTSLLRNDTGEVTGAICSFRDITERKQIENNMEILDRLTSMGEMAAGMAHEIRNPLAGMKTSLQVLQRRIAREGDTVNDQLFENTLYEIDRINKLITELLNFARPRQPVYEPVMVSEVIRRSLELNNQAIEERDMTVTLQEEVPEETVFVDEGQLEQICINLIKNAVKASRPGGELMIRVSRLVQGEGTKTVIVVEDNGEGIDQENLERIFDPFFSTDPKSTGLGLSVVYELVKDNRGTITVASERGKGSRFTLMFPALVGESQEALEDGLGAEGGVKG